MCALQSRIIQNIYIKPLAIRQVTQESLKEKKLWHWQEDGDLKATKKEDGKRSEKVMPIHQMKILKLWKEEKRPKKLQAIKHKAKKKKILLSSFCVVRQKK
jgi:hypothetical protein